MTTADKFTLIIAAMYAAAACLYGYELHGVKCAYFTGCCVCTVLMLWMK